jgi:hypothetical protein
VPIERTSLRTFLTLTLLAFSLPVVGAEDVTYVALVLKVPSERQAGFAQDVEKGCLPMWKQTRGTGLVAGAQLFEVVRVDSSEKGVPDWNFVLLYHVSRSRAVDTFLREGRDRDCFEKVGPVELKREEVLRASPNSYYPLPDSSVRQMGSRVEYWIEYIAVKDTPAALNEYREAMRLTFGPFAAERIRSGVYYTFYGFETQRVVSSAPDMPLWNQVHFNGNLTRPDIPKVDCEALFLKVNPASGGCKVAFTKLDAIRTKPRVDVTRLVLEMQ